MLELRKGYDSLATRLFGGGKLKPRAETREDSEFLGREIGELELEGREFEGVWRGRRDGFERVVGEGEVAIRVIRGIRDEQTEAEKDEQMEEDGEGKEDRSRVGTPAAGGGGTPMLGGGGGETPLPAIAEGGEGERPMTNKFLEVEDATRVNSRAQSPMMGGQGDVEMEMAVLDDQAPLEPQVKTTAGMEVTEDQVVTPAEGLAEQMDES